MSELVIRAHKVAKGKAQGKALVSQSPISFLGGVNPETGVITDKNNTLKGASVAGKILIFPVGKGSTAGSYQLYELAVNEKAPKAIINLRADPIVAIGAILANVPMVDKLEKNPLEVIETGDLVEVDADQGIVKVHSRSV
jgi:predicted aconitase with swiveling domain